MKKKHAHTHDTERRAEARLLACRLAATHAALARRMARQLRRAAFLLLLTFASAAISEGATVRTVAENAGGQGRQPCVSIFTLPGAGLLAAVPDVQSMAIGGLGFVAALIGYHFAFGRYIRQQAGVKETKSTTLEGQPIQVQAAVRFVTHPELAQHLEGYVTREDLHKMETSIVGKIEGDFRELDRKRSHSIGNLHEHLTGTTKSLTEKIADGDAKMHERIEAMSNILRGEFEAKLQTVREDITDLPGRLLTLLQQTGQIGTNSRGGK